jgi:hypothetical protein
MTDADRLTLYGVYASAAELERDLETFCVERSDHRGDARAAHDAVLEDSGTQPSSLDSAAPSNTNPAPVLTTRQTTSAEKDIWGHYTLKEPTNAVPCPVCARPINTLRFAPHLDKCMGIGSLVRGAAASTTSTTSSSK